MHTGPDVYEAHSDSGGIVSRPQRSLLSQSLDLIQMREPKPPRAVGYAVEIGVLVSLVLVFNHPIRGSIDAVLRVTNTFLSGIILYGMYRMRRWAVWTYLLLTIMTAATAVALVGLGAWRGLLIGGILRTAIVAPPLYYWKRLR
jgi:hypothetical protein